MRYHAFAMIKLKACKECGREFGANSKVCPYCGSARRRGFRWRLPLFILVMLGASSYAALHFKIGRDAYLSFAAGRVKALELTSHSRVPYFVVNVIVKNGNWHAVKDLEFVCRHYDEDGVVIGKNRKTIPITMPAGALQEFKKVNLGLHFVSARRKPKNTVCAIESIAI